MTGRLLGAGRLAEVFEDGDAVLKLYQPGIGPERARHEAMVLDAVSTTSLRVPVSFGIVQVDGRWGLRMSRLAGRPLGLPAPGSDPTALVTALALVHQRVLSFQVQGLPHLATRLAERIDGVAQLTSGERSRVPARLQSLPGGDRLCHGDFHPLNIIADGDNLGVIDWLDATSGPPAADIARTWIMARHYLPALADLYLDTVLEGGPTDRQTVLAWLPVVAAARLAEGIDEGAEALVALSRNI
jgi:hypothetical protein